MKTVLTKGLDKQAEEDFRGSFASSKVARKRYVEILREKIKSRQAWAISPERYELPSWPMTQADTVGYIRAMEEVISLLDD